MSSFDRGRQSGRQSQGRGSTDSGRGRGPGSGRGGRDDSSRGGSSDRGRFGGRGGFSSRTSSNMGEIESIKSLVRTITDRDIIRVLEPPTSERSRDTSRETLHLPPISSWRMNNPLGVVVSSGLFVNHFLVDTSKIPNSIYHYHVHVYRVKEGISIAQDEAQAMEIEANIKLMKRIIERHETWKSIKGLVYDGRSALYSAENLNLFGRNTIGEPFQSFNVGLISNEFESEKIRFEVHLTQVRIISGITDFRVLDASLMNILDTSLIGFSIWMKTLEEPSWYNYGSRTFPSAAKDVIEFRESHARAFVAKRGFNLGFKSCLAGLTLVLDSSVNVFLRHGSMIDILMLIGGYNSIEAFLRDCRDGIHPKTLENITFAVKNAKVKSLHLGFIRKIVGLGPPADSMDSSFEHEGRRMTVAQYFELMAKSKPNYRNHLNKGKLRYPSLPTINVGSNNRPVLVPAELCIVLAGQIRNKVMTPGMTADIIKFAATPPDERMKNLLGTDGQKEETKIFSVLRTNPINEAFGISKISTAPMEVEALILPPAKLRYANNSILDPQLEGSWNFDRPQQRKFFKLPLNPAKDGFHPYTVLIVFDRRGAPFPDEDRDKVVRFFGLIEQDANNCGLKLKRAENPRFVDSNYENLSKELHSLSKSGKIIFILLRSEVYGEIKKIAGLSGIPTQCLKWKTIEKCNHNVCLNILLKVNIKLGGTNHTLASRDSTKVLSGESVFQDPPFSLPWQLNDSFMLVGIDVTHPEPGSTESSKAAIVGSYDKNAVHYVSYFSTQKSREEIVSSLEEGLIKILVFYKAKNRVYPKRIIVFRDGVSEGQFQEVLDKELPQIHGALESLAILPDAVKVTMIVCQKRHNTRIFFNNEGTFINPTPGVVIDSRSMGKSITSALFNEFYLNSHVSIQGTGKPCKYVILYDENKFLLSEIEILTYWTTYLYSRCNRSVSYATPAYYAHWASKRCKDLAAVGTTSEEFTAISARWSRTDIQSTMHFL